MYITSRTLIRILQQWNPRAYGNEAVFFFSRILPPGCARWEAGERPLLLLSEDEFLRFQANRQPPTAVSGSPAACIVAGDCDLPGGALEGHPVQNLGSSDDVLIFVERNASLKQEIFPCLLQYYCEKNDELARLKERLLRMMSSGRSLHGVLQTATRIMKNPFIVYDSRYALVAHSVPRTLAVPQAQNVIKNGYANVDIISQMEKDGSLDYVFSHQEHPSLVKIINGYEKLAVSIYNGSDYAGLLCFFNYVRPIREDDYELVRFLGELTRIYFHDRALPNSSWTPWDYLFTTILHQKRSLTEDELARLGLEFPHEMRLMAIAAPSAFRSSHANQLKYLQTRLHHTLPGSHSYFHDGYLLCLDSGRNLSPADSAHMPALLRDLEHLDMIGGISNPFYHISGLRTAFTQAEAAILLGHATQNGHPRLAEYSQVTICHMLSLLDKKYALEDFCHPMFARLEQYDSQYHTNYLKFFLIYFLCGQNSRLCAECFGIHYNSVKYRLNVIQEVGAVNLKEDNAAVLLYLSCRIYMKKKPGLLDQYSDFFERHPEISV